MQLSLPCGDWHVWSNTTALPVQVVVILTAT